MILLLHSSQHVIEWNGCETGGVIGQTIRNDQFAVVQESATCINDIGHVAFTLVLVGRKQGLVEAADHFGGVMQIKEECADAIFSQRADAMTEDQPTSISLDGRPTIPYLDQFPGKSRFKQEVSLIPEVNVV